jgi:AraC-like DNA-binding protein
VDDFASSALVAAVQRAFAEDGIAVVAPGGDGALLPFGAKRRFLTDVAQKVGLLPLLRVGLVLPKMRSDPAVSALLGSSTPIDLFERWRRLERFVHSRHRVVLREAGDGVVLAEHVGPPGAPPEPVEDVLVLGVLTVLLTAIGVQGVTVTVGRSDPTVVFADGLFTAPPPGIGTAHWRFSWSATAGVAHVGVPSGSDVVSRARRLLADDLGRRWTLRGLAADLGISTRSLQRRLRGVGGFQGLLGAVRIEAAADLLLHGGHPLCLVGFACGYADQSHFTRDFKRRMAVTPAVYRSAFAHRPGEPRPDPLAKEMTL